MQPRHARLSLLLFVISIILLLVLTFFESALQGLSAAVERVITFILLVMPALIGAALGMLSLIRKEGRAWLAIAGILLNSVFAIFHMMIVLFAG